MREAFLSPHRAPEIALLNRLGERTHNTALTLEHPFKLTG
jgi:hypothetical protein